MRFIHTSDLHIGKMVNGFSMLEEQKKALEDILGYVREYRPDAVFLCGDLYDRSVPPASAVAVLDEFLTRLSSLDVTILAISGNHDCGERIGFAGRILEKHGLFLEGHLSDPVRFVDMKDSYGTVRIHMVPFAKPAEVKNFYKSAEEIHNFEDSMKEILRHVNLSEEGRNILITHQFVVNEGLAPELSDSESRVSVGGTDQVDAGLFADFCYTALGHIHGSQKIGGGNVFYSGSPVKYSFSEMNHQKSVILGDVAEDGTVAVTRLPLTPIHDMRRIRGRLGQLISPEVAEAEDSEDYILAVLTGDEELIDPIGTLRSVYPNVMQLQWERTTAGSAEPLFLGGEELEKDPFTLFGDFYGLVTGKTMSGEQETLMKEVIEQAKEELS